MPAYSKFIALVLLLALFMSCSSSGVNISISNPLDHPRKAELISIARADLPDGINPEQTIVVFKKGESEFLPSQLLDLDLDGAWETLLVQVSLEAHETQELTVENTDATFAALESKVNGRFVPERMDDFAWENDRIAFRMYGPALEASGEISSGVDVWVKSVEYPIIDKWYADGKYHKDYGEGADLYKVGSTLGCGGLGIWYEDSLYTSKNFTSFRILAHGPLRFVFELDYAEWGVDSLRISETKRISIDIREHFNQIESSIRTFGSDLDMGTFVSGLTAHLELSSIPVSNYSSDEYMILYEGFRAGDGYLGTAILGATIQSEETTIHYGDRYLVTLPISPAGVISYFAGAGWSKSPWLDNEQDWKNVVGDYAARKNNPIQVKFLSKQ